MNDDKVLAILFGISVGLILLIGIMIGWLGKVIFSYIF
jgi:hypothetical protein